MWSPNMEEGTIRKLLMWSPNSNIKIFSTNGAGVKNGKVDSLNARGSNVQTNLVTIQETHCSQKGKIIMNSGL